VFLDQSSVRVPACTARGPEAPPRFYLEKLCLFFSFKPKKNHRHLQSLDEPVQAWWTFWGIERLEGSAGKAGVEGELDACFGELKFETSQFQVFFFFVFFFLVFLFSLYSSIAALIVVSQVFELDKMVHANVENAIAQMRRGVVKLEPVSLLNWQELEADDTRAIAAKLASNVTLLSSTLGSTSSATRVPPRLRRHSGSTQR
jgi:hypothetical protein